MNEILLLVDDEYNFQLSIDKNHEYHSMNLYKLCKYFKKFGWIIKIIKFKDLDLEQNFKNKFILYQSSERQGGFYKSYIEDIIYYLENRGAIVLPKYEYLKAHHNKVYMELLRKSFKNDDLKTIRSWVFGSLNDALSLNPKFPVVLKTAAGAGSYGVRLARNEKEYKKVVKELSKVYYYESLYDMGKYVIKKIIFPRIMKTHKKVERKFIVQTFVNNLKGDYKVLYYGGKYYTLYRKNRNNDFRASGSGKLFPVSDEENIPLLNFAKKLVKEIDFPIIGMDIGFDGEKYHLLEFQMTHLGPYTLQFSNYYFIKDGKDWKKIEEKSDLEYEFVRSIVEFIVDKYKYILI